MEPIRLVTVVDQPVDVVFGFIETVENTARCNPSVTKAEQLTPPPMGVGSKARMRCEMLGRHLDVIWECTEYERNVRLTNVGRYGLASITAAVSFYDLGRRTQLESTFSVTMSRAFRPMAGLVGVALRSQVESSTAAMKRILESVPVESA